MPPQIQLGDISVEVVKKDIKNIHLSVYPPVGRVRISAPKHMKTDTIRVFAISKLSWIKQQREKLREQERESRREYIDRESHYAWGKRRLLKVVEADAPPSVELVHGRMVLSVRPGATPAKRKAVVDEWYRQQLKDAIPPLIAKWEKLMGVMVEGFLVRKMKTKWGSCSHERGTIRINLELAKKPPACLEYIVVHEMVHLLEPTHNARFVGYMDQFMPQWRFHREELNRLPVRHEEWTY